jgi:hypothetical protein
MARWFSAGPVPRSYRVVLDGEVLEGRTIGDLFNAYAGIKRLKGELLFPEWEEALWAALGKAYPKHVKRTGKAAPPGVSVATAASFLTFMLKRVRNRKLVPLAQAEARAVVCRRCPMAQPVLGCSVCKDALKWAGALPIEISIPEACGACGCHLRSKVQFPRELLGGADDYPYWKGDATRPRCWMRTELEKE